MRHLYLAADPPCLGRSLLTDFGGLHAANQWLAFFGATDGTRGDISFCGAVDGDATCDLRLNAKQLAGTWPVFRKIFQDFHDFNNVLAR